MVLCGGAFCVCVTAELVNIRARRHKAKIEGSEPWKKTVGKRSSEPPPEMSCVALPEKGEHEKAGAEKVLCLELCIAPLTCRKGLVLAK